MLRFTVKTRGQVTNLLSVIDGAKTPAGTWRVETTGNGKVNIIPPPVLGKSAVVVYPGNFEPDKLRALLIRAGWTDELYDRIVTTQRLERMRANAAPELPTAARRGQIIESRPLPADLPTGDFYATRGYFRGCLIHSIHAYEGVAAVLYPDFPATVARDAGGNPTPRLRACRGDVTVIYDPTGPSPLLCSITDRSANERITPRRPAIVGDSRVMPVTVENDVNPRTLPAISHAKAAQLTGRANRTATAGAVFESFIDGRPADWSFETDDWTRYAEGREIDRRNAMRVLNREYEEGGRLAPRPKYEMNTHRLFVGPVITRPIHPTKETAVPPATISTRDAVNAYMDQLPRPGEFRPQDAVAWCEKFYPEIIVSESAWSQMVARVAEARDDITRVVKGRYRRKGAGGRKPGSGQTEPESAALDAEPIEPAEAETGTGSAIPAAAEPFEPAVVEEERAPLFGGTTPAFIAARADAPVLTAADEERAPLEFVPALPWATSPPAPVVGLADRLAAILLSDEVLTREGDLRAHPGEFGHIGDVVLDLTEFEIAIGLRDPANDRKTYGIYVRHVPEA